MKAHFCWGKYKYFSYEKALACRELLALTGQEPEEEIMGLSAESAEWEQIAYRTTYFREAYTDDGKQVVPLQTLLENSVNGKSNHQQTRYSAHGIHEYRGKFNPQIVRSVGNICGIQAGNWILDPFCGSGTTLLEAAHCGWNAYGIDLNPLAVIITEAKIAAMKIPLLDFVETTENFLYKIKTRYRNFSYASAFTEKQMMEFGGENWHSCLNDNYLQKWFMPSTLVQISSILNEISEINSSKIQLILRVILSDILREVSLQDASDLRIRRRKSSPENIPVLPFFIETATKKLEAIFKTRAYIPDNKITQTAFFGDAKNCKKFITESSNSTGEKLFDAVITSPPYATALPYIDTQRLSLVLLNLITADKIHQTEKNLIGNREITEKERLLAEKAIDINDANLPLPCIKICQLLKESVDREKDGFRRRNMPSLIYKYLTDMADVFENLFYILKPDAPLAMIIGRNTTCLGGKFLTIDTPHYLTLLAEKNGFRLQEKIELNTYPRYDIHQTNSIRTETLLILRRH